MGMVSMVAFLTDKELSGRLRPLKFWRSKKSRPFQIRYFKFFLTLNFHSN